MPVTVSAAMAALVSAVVLLRSARLSLITLALAAVIVVGWSRAGSSDSALAHFTGASAGLLLMSVVGGWCNTEARLRTCVGVVLMLATLALVIGLLGTRTPYPKVFMPAAVVSTQPILRFEVPGLAADGHVNPNALGAAALLILPLGCAAALVARRGTGGRTLPTLGVVAALVSGGILVFSQSRSAWLAVVLLLAVAGWRSSQRWIRRATGVAVLAMAGVAAIVGASAIGKPGVEISAGRRPEIFEQGVTVLRQAPWFGVGLNEFRYRYQVKPYGWPVAHAHNVFLQTALDIGVVGLGLYVGLIGLLLVWADRTAQQASPLVACIAAGAGLSVLAAHLFGLVDAVALGAKVGVFQWLAAGLIIAAHTLSGGAQVAGGARSDDLGVLRSPSS